MTFRRKMLTSSLSILAAGTASLKWHKPIVSSIILPAHAQTSNFIPSGTFTHSPGFSLVCLEFIHSDNRVLVNAKFSIRPETINYTQGSIEVSKNDSFIGRINLDKDCNGLSIDPIDSIIIESYTETEVVFALQIEKTIQGLVAIRGDCRFDNATCKL